MAGPTKKAKKPAKPESADEEYDSEESGSYHGQQEIQATFEGRNPEAHDFHGIQQLLKQLLHGHIDLSQMTDMLIAQTGIGSVLKQSCSDSDDEEDMEMTEESDVFGITSILNLSSHKETPCVQQLHQYLIEECKKNASQETQQKFEEIVKNCNRLGFLVNERFVNIPSKISAPMLTSLVDEITRFRKKDDSYNFEYFLMICKLMKPKNGTVDEELYSNDEEQLFVRHSEANFQFSVANKSDTGLTGNWQSEDKELIPYRCVILFKADKLPQILDEIKIYVQA